MKFQNGKDTTRKRLFHKIQQQVTIRCSERRRRAKRVEHRWRKMEHMRDKKRFAVHLRTTVEIIAGGAVTETTMPVTAIRGMGEDIHPARLNKKWLAWKGKADVKTFYKWSPVSNFYVLKRPFKFIVSDETNGFSREAKLFGKRGANRTL